MGPNLVALLPKGGSRQPRDRLPIVLLSALYRVWAGIRVAEKCDWLRGEWVLPPASGVGAEFRAAELALLLDKSGHEVAGLAVDWSKCYKRVPLAMVAAIARAARVHLGVCRPMLVAYSLRRRVRGALREHPCAPASDVGSSSASRAPCLAGWP